MKKLLSLFLVLAMILSSMAMLASCSGDQGGDEGGTKQDTKKANAFAEFFDLGVDLATPMEAAMKNGSLTLSLGANKTLFGENFGGFTEAVYFADGGERSVLDLSLSLLGEAYGVRAFSDKDGNMIVKSEDIFGSDTAYLVNLATFIEDLEGTPLGDMMGVTPGAGVAGITALGTLSLAGKSEEELKAFLDDLLACFTPKESTADITVGGKEISAKKVTYAVTPATVKDAILTVIDFGGVDADLREEIESSMIQGMGEGGGSLVLYTDAKSGAFVKAVLSITDEDDEEILNGSLTLTEKDITFKLTEQGRGVEAKIAKTVSGKTTTFRLTADFIANGEKETLFAGSFAYDKAKSSYTLTLDVEDQQIILGGEISATADKAKISLTSVKMEDVTVSLDFSLTVKASATAPKAPTNAKNILTLSESELAALFEAIEDSPIGELLDGMSASPAPVYCEWCGRDVGDTHYSFVDEYGYSYRVCYDCYENRTGVDDAAYCELCYDTILGDPHHVIDDDGRAWTLCYECLEDIRCECCGDPVFTDTWYVMDEHGNGMWVCETCYTDFCCSACGVFALGDIYFLEDEYGDRYAHCGDCYDERTCVGCGDTYMSVYLVENDYGDRVTFCMDCYYERVCEECGGFDFDAGFVADDATGLGMILCESCYEGHLCERCGDFDNFTPYYDHGMHVCTRCYFG